jgi:hypothetical protein
MNHHLLQLITRRVAGTPAGKELNLVLVQIKREIERCADDLWSTSPVDMQQRFLSLAEQIEEGRTYNNPRGANGDPMEVSFSTTKEEAHLIVRIIDRVTAYRRQVGGDPIDRMELQMDITACHANGCPLDLKKLLEAPDIDFVHDVFGIHYNIDRTTGKLENHFLPRCAQSQKED